MEKQQLEIQDFRLYLQDELLRRCQKNPHYSLRAFAKALSIGPSALSDILNKKRSLTEAMKMRLGLALGLNAKDLLMYKSNSKTRPKHLTDSVDRKEFQQITLDTYAIISDWYHYAILELIRVKNFKTDIKWIAQVLGITKSEANIAVERLQRVGLLDITECGKWVDCSANGLATNINGNVTSAASKKLQRQILEKSIQALAEVPIEKRNHTSGTFAMNPEDLPIAIEQIKKFRRKLGLLLESNPVTKQVYQLSISLYPVTNIQENKND